MSGVGPLVESIEFGTGCQLIVKLADCKLVLQDRQLIKGVKV